MSARDLTVFVSCHHDCCDAYYSTSYMVVKFIIIIEYFTCSISSVDFYEYERTTTIFSFPYSFAIVNLFRLGFNVSTTRAILHMEMQVVLLKHLDLSLSEGILS